MSSKEEPGGPWGVEVSRAVREPGGKAGLCPECLNPADDPPHRDVPVSGRRKEEGKGPCSRTGLENIWNRRGFRCIVQIPQFCGSGSKLRRQGTRSRSHGQWQNWDKNLGLLTQKVLFPSPKGELWEDELGETTRTIITITLANTDRALKPCATKSWLHENSKGPAGTQNHPAQCSSAHEVLGDTVRGQVPLI